MSKKEKGILTEVPGDGQEVEGRYRERLHRFSVARGTEGALSTRLGWIRVGVFLLGFSLYVLWDVTSGLAALWALWGMVLSLVAFVWLIIWHRRVRHRERKLGLLVEINRVALARLGRVWGELPDSRISSPGSDHPYALDLDVGGTASLFRLLTTPTLPVGSERLREWMLEPASPEEILRRQESVQELASEVDRLQEWEATGRSVEGQDPEVIRAFLKWAEEDPWLPAHPWLLLGAWALPLLSAALAALQLWGPLPGPWWLFSVGASFALANRHRIRIHGLMDAASGGQERFSRYASLLTRLMEMEVEAELLVEAQGAVRSSPVGATQELRRLGRRMGWADIRFSGMAHVPLQALVAWDVHVLASLERWKRKSGPHVRGWLEALGQVEALAALATLKADHPEWSFPEVGKGEGMFLRAKALGHPLLSAKVCVAKDVVLGPPGSFLFVTGSNMSGKSTLLRAVGLNAVLAQAGGPVCAAEMTLPPLRVFTSMRTTDSLSEGVSQYMAELNRIKQVVEGARSRESGGVLFLLDEPLQGTNEAERRVAVQTIIGHLLEAEAIGAVATHDLQLDDTPELEKAAEAVHLEGQVREGDDGPLISFDYLLRLDRASSTNALALLRAVGLGKDPG